MEPIWSDRGAKMTKNDKLPDSIGKIEAIIGYFFRDKSLLVQAFTRTSFCNEANQRSAVKYQSNEVLEFFGDGVLSASIITFLLTKHAERYEHGIRTRLDEGDFSNIKSKLSDKKNLSLCIATLGLQHYLRMGEGDAKLGIENEPSVMEDLFESIIGAIYIDSDMNMPTVMQVVSRMLDLNSLTSKEPPLQSAKNALQEYCQDKSRRLPPPRYETLGEEGPDHKKQYRRGVFVGDRLIADGVGKNLKLADAAAAEAALSVLKKEDESKAERANSTKSRPQTAKPTEPATKSDKKTTKVDTRAGAKGAKKPNTAPNNSARPTPKAKKATAPTTKAATKNTDAKTKATSTNSSDKSTRKPAEKSATGSKTSDKKKATRSSAASAQKMSVQRTSSSAKGAAPTASAGLKSHAAQKKIANPTFKDLGESREGNKAVYRVECIFMGRSATGVGATRPEAKENAARLILDSMRGAKAKKKK